MAQLRSIDTYPLSGGPEVTAFHAAGIGVCEAFSAALTEQRVSTRLSGVRVFLHLAEPPLDDGRAHVEVRDHKEGFERADAMLPAGVAGLPSDARRLLLLDVLCTVMDRLGELRGWDHRAVPAAREHALESGLTFVWSSPWKASRDRRHQARASYTVGEAGAGLAAVEIRRAGETEPFTWSPPARAWHTVEGFRRSARTLRWSASDTVELVPFAGLFGESGGDVHHSVGMAPAGPDALLRPAPRLADDVPRPSVVLVTKGPDHREIRPIGGGPSFDAARLWHDELYRLWGELERPEWLAWWTPAGVATLELWWSTAAAHDRVVVRRGKERLIARIEHRPGSVWGSDGAEVARADMEALVAAVARREGLGAPPAFGRPVGDRRPEG